MTSKRQEQDQISFFSFPQRIFIFLRSLLSSQSRKAGLITFLEVPQPKQAMILLQKWQSSQILYVYCGVVFVAYFDQCLGVAHTKRWWK